jgi:hypothetical protein
MPDKPSIKTSKLGLFLTSRYSGFGSSLGKQVAMKALPGRPDLEPTHLDRMFDDPGGRRMFISVTA